MTASKAPMIQLAKVYGVSSPSLAGLVIRHGITPEVVADPHLLFRALLKNGRSGKLRTRLADPVVRESLKAEIHNLHSK